MKEWKIVYTEGAPDWESADYAPLCDVVTGAVPTLTTKVAAFYNERGLFVRFVCEDNGIVATMTSFNDPIYEEDVVEMFLDDDGDPATYYEFNVSPIGTHLHYVVMAPNIKFARIEDHIKSRVSVTENLWTATVFVPASEFTRPPQKGRVWRGNFYRIDRGETDEYSALSPTGKVQFHSPAHFLTIRFI